ncbi:MAG: DNA phosphorothioation-dependent restriction protein DptH [Lachnospiraceae bacterium]|nr:DNA phosphorothioation-dependent restriction protein DptH [Lachnospiraceae bacterium]
MSNTFYSYISEKIIKYFQSNEPVAGDKYYIQFETEEQVNKLYLELGNNVIAKKFVYQDVDRNQKYDTYELNFGQIQLIIAASMDGGPHPDFLATLRNLVGVERGYEKKAILFIHCSSLDSILGGAGSLGKEGMPLNISDIKKDIDRRINETGYSELDKTILRQYLENKSKELDGTVATIFEYEDIIQCLSDSQITADEYKKFELFPDEILPILSGKELRNRLEENHQNYVKISEIHSFGTDFSKLENLYGEDGAKALSKLGWEQISFSDVKNFAASKKNKSTIEYLPIISNPTIWDKEEGASKAKSRTRNILLFIDNTQNEVEIELVFSDFTKSAGINVLKAYQAFLSVTNSGKKLTAKISEIDDKTVFGRFIYEADGTKFEFKIAVLRCKPNLLENIKTQYIVETRGTEQDAIRIISEDDKVIINSYGQAEKEVYITENGQVVSLNENDLLSITISEDYPYAEENEDVHFSLSTTNFVIPIIKAFAVEKPTVIEGMKLWYLKRTKQCNFEIQGDNSLVFGTKKYFARDEFRKSLELEKRYINLGSPFVVENSGVDAGFDAVDISLPLGVKQAFDDIIIYFKSNKEIPSLVYVDSNLEMLYKHYLNEIILEIEAIGEGTYLSEEQKGLFYLGIVKRNYGDKEILLSPLHPINVAYQLFINGQQIGGLEEDEIDLLRKFQQTAMLPYINMDLSSKIPKVYLPVEQIHSPEWKIYVEEDLPRYKGSKDFVSKLVSEKIREFIEHFSYLFSAETNTPIRINLINTGDCREIVQGIMKYYVHELNSAKIKKVIPIQVTMYAESKIDNAFEVMSKVDDPDILVKSLGIEAKVSDMSIEEIVDVYRSNVCFYFKDINDQFGYSHITFIELDDEHQAITTVMDDIPSGVVMNGIASGVPSVMLGDSYRTGFGTKFANLNTTLLNVAAKYNAINAAMNGDAYRGGSCYALKMGVNKQKILDRIYDASNWVTFINPKVDLNYFKSDPSAKDLLIIHYSDQYNMTSSGYDAITVTKKSKQYQNAISRYLEMNGVENVQEHSKRIINMFNALNGDWLLRMLSYKSHFPVEKLSILSAMKLAVKRYSIEDVNWIPVSLEEILRVSGSVGLSQNEAIFSAKNLGFDGQTSDDLLLVGILNGENVKITFYPIEVKIGKVEPDYLKKGVEQALETRKIFDSILQLGSCDGKDIKTRLYRNFFMQQVVVNAEKMMLYGVGKDNSAWEVVTKTELRKKLLNEEYEIVETLIPKMGRAGVISFREECTKERELRSQDVLIVEKTKREGVNLLATTFDDISPVEWSLVQETADLSTIGSDTISDEDEESSVENIPTNVNDDEIENERANDDTLEVADTDDEIRVLIGEDRFNHKVFWEFGNKALANRHMLITGTSGQGKTYSIQAMLYELAKKNISAVIFDYTEGFMLQQLEQPFKDFMGDKINQHIVYSTGVPINPFQRQQVELVPGQIILEKESDVAARLADIFAHVYSFGDQQYSAIFDAVYNGLVKYSDKMNMQRFRDELEEIVEQNKTAKSVLSKMSPFFHTVEFSSDPDFNWGDILYADDAKVNIIQLTMFTQEMKVIITEMMLWDAWYYTKKFGTKEKPFVVVLDEAQNLSHAMKSPSATILTEGRKFGWSAWFATQSLGVLKSDEVVRLLQASFKLYFKPTDNEIVKTAKQLDVTGEVDWLSEVQRLRKGQCIAVGDKMKANGTVGPAEPVVTSITSFDERG